MKYKGIIYSAILLIVFILLSILMTSYIQPIVVTVGLLILSLPIHKLITKNNIFNSKTSAVISLIFVNGFLFIIILFIGNFLFTHIRGFIRNQYEGFIVDFVNMYNRIILFNKIDTFTIKEGLKGVFHNVFNSRFLTKGAVYTTEQILTYFIGNITAYFILSDTVSICDFIKKIITEENYYILCEKSVEVKKLFKILFLSVGVNTIITIAGFSALSVENSIVLGIVCGLLDIIPYVGIFIIFIPLFVYYITIKQYIIAFGIILLYILLMVNTQMIQTKFMSNKLQIHPLPMVLALYIGMKNFGVVGMIMGPLYVITVNEFILRHLQQNNKPVC